MANKGAFFTSAQQKKQKILAESVEVPSKRSTDSAAIAAPRSAESYETSYRVNSLLKNANSYLSNFNGDVNTEVWTRSGFDAKSFFEERKKEAEAIRSEIADTERYFNRNWNKYTSDGMDYYRQLLSGVNTDVDDILGRYESIYTDIIDNPGKYQAAQQRRAMLDADLSALQKELDELNAQYDNYQYDASTFRGRMAAEADLQRMEKEISQKQQYLNQARHLQEGVQMASVSRNADFDAMSKQQIGIDDPVYQYVNRVYGAREFMDRSHNPAIKAAYDQMTEEEVANYNYHYATGGKEQAQRYLDTIAETLNQRKAGQMYAEVQGQTAKELLFGAGAGLNQAAEGFLNNFSNDDYIAPSAYQIAGGMVREDLADNGLRLPEWMGGASLGQVGYDLINTAANMAPSMAIGALNPIVGTLTMGASAAGNAYQEALNEGYSKDQARAYSALVGASEAGLEYLMGGISSLGGLIPGGIVEKILDGVDNAFKRFAISMGGSMIGEGFEEGLQEVLTPYFQNLALNTDKDVNWNEVAYFSLLGALSGGVMEAPGTAANAVSYSLRNRPSTGSPSSASAPSTPALTEKDIKAKVAEDGKSRIISTGENVGVNDFHSINGGEATILLENGNSAPMDDVNFASTEEAARFMTIKSLPGIETEAANDLYHAMVDNNAGSDTDTIVGVRDAYALGYYGFQKSDATKNGTDAAKLSPALRTAAFEAGQKQRSMNAAVAPKVSAPSTAVKPASGYKRVVFEGKPKLDKKTRAEVHFMDFVAEKFSGTTVHVYQSFKGKGGKYYYRDTHGKIVEAPNGRYVNDEIWIDLNSGDKGEGLALNTFAHEMYHHVEKWSQKGAQKLAEFVVKELGMTDVKSAVNEQIKKAEAAGYGVEHFMKYGNNGKGMTREQAINAVEQRAMSDFVADSLETMFIRGDAAEVITRLKEEDRGLFDKIKEFIDEWVSTLKQWYSDKTISEEGKMVAQLERFEELQKLFIEAVSEAGSNYNAAVQSGEQKSTTRDGDAMYSSRNAVQDNITNQYKQTVDQVLNMQNTNPDHVVIGYTPKIYEELGMPSLPFVIGTGHIYSAAKTETEAKQDGNYHSKVHYHGLGANIVKNIYDKLEDPVMIIASKDIGKKQTPMRSTHSVVAIVDVGNSQKSLLLPIEITAERTVDGIRMDVNALSSIYDKAVSNLVNEAIAIENTGDVGIFYARKEALTLPGAGVQFPVLLQQSIASSGIIHKFSEKVNMNIGEATQSQQFKRWFGDWQNDPKKASKIVKPDGTPKVMYHGSPAQFSRFDRKKAKSSGLYGRGFYFTDSDSHAKTYGNTYSVYLNIRNPLQSGNTTVTRQQVRSYLEAVAENEDYSIENYGNYDVDSILNTVMGKDGKADAFKVIQDINATAIGDMVEAAELFNSINGTTFDGIVVPTETVAFRPEQIKSATDNIGTFDGQNDDIYHSLRNAPENIHDVRRRIAAGMDDAANTGNLKKWAEEYREKIAQAEAIESNLKIKDQQIQELGSSKNPTDKQKFYALRREVNQMRDELGKLNKRIQYIESLKAFRDISAGENASYGKSLLQQMREQQAENIQQQLLENRIVREELTGKDSDITIMEKEFIRIAKKYEQLDAKTGKKISDLRNALKAEADSHKAESRLWQREFNRLLREYETSGRKIERLEATIARQRATAKARVQSRRNTELRHKIQRKANELNNLLLHGTKNRNIPEYLQPAVAGILDAINMEVRDIYQRTETFEQTMARYTKRINMATDANEVRRLLEKRDAYAKKALRFEKEIDNLKKAYEKIKESADTNFGIDDGLYSHLMTLFVTVGDTPLGQMTQSQLEAVNDVLNITKETVSNANKLFHENQRMGVEETSKAVMGEVRSVGGETKKRLSVLKNLSEFGWLNLKPIHAFEMIGSEKLTNLFKNARKGEDTLASDLHEAKEFFRNQWNRHNGKDWDREKQYTFKSSTGKSFSLTLDQIMSLYALSKREQARDHLRTGGFAFDSSYKTQEELKVLGIPIKVGMESTDASAYNLTDEILGEIIGTLSTDQRAFVDAMQAYLSDNMAAKGNEVSLKKYGIKLFKDQNYFPLRIADQYMAKKREEQGDRKLKNAGFTQATTPKANNPVVLSGFMDVWGEHVDEMSLYHSFVLPLDDIERVLNYHDRFAEGADSQSVVEAIRNAYGTGASKYIDQLIKDINGGARTDGVAKFINQGFSKAKKAQTLASLSVAIQQPSAILRAGAMMDSKYFFGPRVTEKSQERTWEEIKRYAPIARIKEMGGFDVNVGKSTVEYLTDTTDYVGWDKISGFLKDGKYRDDVLGRIPAWVDELGWGVIWNAVKREIADKHPDMDRNGNAFMKMVADRFTDVIVHTQVYDSVFSRNGMMRSTDTGAKMVTAFMAEPATTANMLAAAIVKAKRGGQGSREQLIKTVSAITGSLIINSALSAIVYAMRDDDEDESMGEKWLEHFHDNLFESLHPASYIPILRDIVSKAKGFDVERADMALYGDLLNAINGLNDDNRTAWEKVETVVGAVGNFLGIPLKNIIRDGKGVFNLVARHLDNETGTSTGRHAAVGGAVDNAIKAVNPFYKKRSFNDGEQLLLAIQRGDEAHWTRVAERFDSLEDAVGALKTAIGTHYKDGSMTESEATDLLMTYGDMDEGEIYWKLKEWDHGKAKGNTENYSKFGALHQAIESGDGIEAEIDRYVEHGTDKSDIRSDISRLYKKEYLAAAAEDREAIRQKVTPAYAHTDMDEDEIEAKFNDWDFEAKYGMSYSEYKAGYLDDSVSRFELEDAMKFYGLKNYQISKDIRQMDEDKKLRDRFGMSLTEMKDAYDDGDVSRNQLINALVYNGMTQKEASQEVTQRDIRNRLGVDYSELDDAYRTNEISRQDYYNALVENGATGQEAEEAIRGYDWMKKNRVSDLTITDAMRFTSKISDKDPNHTLEDYGVSVDSYKTYKRKAADCTGVDANGDGKIDSNSRAKQLFAMIDQLPISKEAKEGLALITNAKSTIKKYAPWH